MVVVPQRLVSSSRMKVASHSRSSRRGTRVRESGAHTGWEGILGGRVRMGVPVWVVLHWSSLDVVSRVDGSGHVVKSQVYR